MVCCNLRAFFSDSQKWSGWGSCRHNCSANLELIAEPKVKPIKYIRISFCWKRKKLNRMSPCLMERINKKEIKGRKRNYNTEWRRKKDLKVCLIFSLLSCLSENKKKKKNSDFETLKVPRGKYLRRQKQSGDEEKKTIHSEYLLIFWLAIVF